MKKPSSGAVCSAVMHSRLFCSSEITILDLLHSARVQMISREEAQQPTLILKSQQYLVWRWTLLMRVVSSTHAHGHDRKLLSLSSRRNSTPLYLPRLIRVTRRTSWNTADEMFHHLRRLILLLSEESSSFCLSTEPALPLHQLLDC